MMRYMIVDDNPGMREMIRMIVAGETDDILECADGMAAVQQFEAFRPDYVLMDIQMQEMDGFAATAKIRTLDPAAKVILVTNHTTPAFRAKAKALGTTGFVAKENLSEVAEIIQRDLGGMR